MEKRVQALIDLKVNALRADIARESKTRFENIEHLENCLEVMEIIIYECYRMTSLSFKKRSGTSPMRERSLTMLCLRRSTRRVPSW